MGIIDALQALSSIVLVSAVTIAAEVGELSDLANPDSVVDPVNEQGGKANLN